MTRETNDSRRPESPPSDTSNVKEHIRKLLAKVRGRRPTAAKRSAFAGMSVRLARYRLPVRTSVA
jgi:hypothetical protein